MMLSIFLLDHSLSVILSFICSDYVVQIHLKINSGTLVMKMEMDRSQGESSSSEHSSPLDVEAKSSQEQRGVKPQITHEENAPQRRSRWKLSKTGDGDTAMALFDRPESPEEPVDPDLEKKLVRRIDSMIIPYLAVCYAFFYIDKTTLSYAAIFGINQDLQLSGTEYSWLSSMFYFGFLVWALPTNLLLQRFPVGKYLGFNIFLWGAFLMIQAACQNFGQLAVLRALSGAAEACSDPGFMLITGMWYTRREQPLRMVKV